MRLDSVEVSTTRLDSGLRVIAFEHPNCQRVVVEGQLRIGSRYESRDENGISHFLEHMLYRGTPRYPTAHAQALAFENLGGTLVATTAADVGTLSISVPRENYREVVDLYAEAFQKPQFYGIEVERGIVSEEILEGLDDNGNNVDADNWIREVAFDGHPLGLPITGTLDHLSHFDAAKLAQHHARFYVGENTVIAIAGPIDAAALTESVAEAFAGLAQGASPSATPPPAQSGPRFRFVKYADSQTALRLAFRGPSVSDADEPAVDLLLRILDDGMSTRLYSEICDKKGLCYDVSGTYEAYEDAGLIELSAESGHERCEAVLAQFLDICRALAVDGPTEAEIDKAKRRHRWQLDDMLTSAEDLTSYYAAVHLAGVPRSLGERRELVDGVSRDALVRVARRFLCPEGLNVVAVGMQNKRAKDKLERLVESYQLG